MVNRQNAGAISTTNSLPVGTANAFNAVWPCAIIRQHVERLFTPEKPWEAHLLRGLLEQAGVSVHVVSVPSEGVGPMEVWVRSEERRVGKEADVGGGA